MSTHHYSLPCRVQGYGEVKTGTIDVTIDLEALALALAQKAFNSKGKKSQLMRGVIKARVVGALQIEHGRGQSVGVAI